VLGVLVVWLLQGGYGGLEMRRFPLTLLAICPDMDAIKTILPWTPFLTSILAVCLAVRNVPVTLTRWMRSKSACG